MATATYTKFEQFGEHLLRGYHGDLHTQTVKIYLTNATPDDGNDVKKADLAEIAGTPAGYTNGGKDVVNTVAELTGTAGMWALATIASLTWTSTETGTTQWPTFRYVVAYNDSITAPTGAADGLIAWWDYGAGVTLDPTDTFKVTFANSRMFTINCT